MNVELSDEALYELRDIEAFIARRSPEAAERTINRIVYRIDQIAQFPNSGRKVPEVDLPQLREVIESPYRIVYKIEPERIVIIRILHGAERLL